VPYFLEECHWCACSSAFLRPLSP